MTTNKRKVESIDEMLLLSSIREKTELSVGIEKGKEVKEPVKKKHAGRADYVSVFLQKNELKTRHGVYISRDMYETISEIVRVIASKEVTVGGYIENVLSRHLESHKDEINELYKQDRKDLIP